jgi:hypothetical protein
MTTRPDYPDLVAQAEKAVAGVKDPELKRIAFQKILDDLLGPSGSVPTRQSPPSKKQPAAAPKAKRGPKAGPQAYLEELVDEGFFKKLKTIAHVKAELQNRGHHIPITSLSGPLQKLCQRKRKKLRRQKLKTSGKKQTFAYSNW